MSPNILFCSNIFTGRSLWFTQSNENSVSRSFELQSAGSLEGCGPPVTRLLPVKPTSNPPIMSRSESGSDVSSSSSDDSDNERSAKFTANRDLVIPSSVELSDSDGDGVSPSQHKLALAMAAACRRCAAPIAARAVTANATAPDSAIGWSAQLRSPCSRMVATTAAQQRHDSGATAAQPAPLRS
jgi:hypothetical protein